MNKKILLTLFIGFFFLVSLWGINGQYTNDANGRLNWIKDAGSTIVKTYKNWSNKNIEIEDAETTIGNSWSMKNNSGEEISINYGNHVVGSSSIKFIYNVTNPAYTWFRKTIINTNLSNSTGVGFWLKGDGTKNGLYIEVGNSSSISWRYKNLIYLNISNWEYYYLDFSQFRNQSGTDEKYLSQKIISNGLSDFTITVFHDVTQEDVKAIYLDDIQFVDFDKGSTNIPRNDKTTILRNSRYMEGTYLTAWLYNNGGIGYTGNTSYLNATIDMMDWLVRNQWSNGGWQEKIYTTPSNDDTSTVGFVGTSFGLAYKEIKGNSRLYENITIRWQNNISTRTREEFYNLTLQNSANYTYNNFPKYVNNYFYANQQLGTLMTEYTWFKISRDENYLIDIEKNLELFNKTYFNHNFGFPLEQNQSDNMGISPTYQIVNLYVMGLLSNLTNNKTILEPLEKEMGKSIINLMQGKEDKLYLPNGSRHASTNPEADNNGTSRYLNSLIYNMDSQFLKQFAYYSNKYNWNTSKGYGVYNLGNTDHNEYKSSFFNILDYLKFENQIDNGFRFPMNYSNKYIKYLDQTLNQVRTTYNITDSKIESRNGTEFPIIIFAYDNGTSIYSRIQNFTLTESNNNFTYSDSGIIIDNLIQVWFSSSTSTSKHIASNLSDTINATVVFNVDSCVINRIQYTSDSGNYTKLYQNGDFSCSDNKVTLIVQQIEPAINSNILTITYNNIAQETGYCTNVYSGFLVFFNNFGTILSILVTVIIISIIGIIIFISREGFEMNNLRLNGNNLDMNMDMEKLIGGAILIALSIAIITILTIIISNALCPII